MSNWVWVTGAKIIRDNFQFRELSFPALEANDPKLSPAILWNTTTQMFPKTHQVMIYIFHPRHGKKVAVFELFNDIKQPFLFFIRNWSRTIKFDCLLTKSTLLMYSTCHHVPAPRHTHTRSHSRDPGWKEPQIEIVKLITNSFIDAKLTMWQIVKKYSI